MQISFGVTLVFGVVRVVNSLLVLSQHYFILITALLVKKTFIQLLKQSRISKSMVSNYIKLC